MIKNGVKNAIFFNRVFFFFKSNGSMILRCYLLGVSVFSVELAWESRRAFPGRGGVGVGPGRLECILDDCRDGK